MNNKYHDEMTNNELRNNDSVISVVEFTLIIEKLYKHCFYGKRQTVSRCVSQTHENLPFSTCLTLMRSYSIYLVNRQERSLNKSSFSLF